MAGTRMYVKGVTRSAHTARKLIALSGPTARALAQTVEILGESRDVFADGCVVYIRSTISPLRYLIVEWEEECYTCSCGEKDCPHARKAKRYLNAQKYHVLTESQTGSDAESTPLDSRNEVFSYVV